MNQIIKSVAIFGSADVAADTDLYKAAFDAAQALAQSGRQVVNGGGPGVMEAATLGARAGNGKSLTVSFTPTDAPFFEGKSFENHSDQDIRANNYIERLNGLIEHSDAFVIFQGGTGTLSEWATVWLLAHIYYGKHKPLILYGSFWNEVMDVISRNFFIGDTERLTYRVVTTSQGMIQALREFEAVLQNLRAQAEHNGYHTEPKTTALPALPGMPAPSELSKAIDELQQGNDAEPRLTLEHFTSQSSRDLPDEPVLPAVSRLRAMLNEIKKPEPADFFDRAVPIPTPIIDVPPPAQSGANRVFSAADIDLMELMPPRSAPYGEPNV